MYARRLFLIAMLATALAIPIASSQAQPLNLDITLTPTFSIPIVLPPMGGALPFNVTVVNNGPLVQPFVLWSRMHSQTFGWMNQLGPVTINPPPGLTITRPRTVAITGPMMVATYTYVGYVNWTYSYPPVDSSYFMIPLGPGDVDASPWPIAGVEEPFPYEVSGTCSAADFKLIGASPNPFNPSTAISYQLSAISQVSLRVYDTAGRLIATLVDGRQGAGEYSVTFDGSRLASGMYLYTLQAGGQIVAGKMMLVK